MVWSWHAALLNRDWFALIEIAKSGDHLKFHNMHNFWRDRWETLDYEQQGEVSARIAAEYLKVGGEHD